jgi:hypothetical protein
MHLLGTMDNIRCLATLAAPETAIIMPQVAMRVDIINPTKVISPTNVSLPRIVIRIVLSMPKLVRRRVEARWSHRTMEATAQNERTMKSNLLKVESRMVLWRRRRKRREMDQSRPEMFPRPQFALEEAHRAKIWIMVPRSKVTTRWRWCKPPPHRLNKVMRLMQKMSVP